MSEKIDATAEVKTYIDSAGRKVLEYIEVFGEEANLGKKTYVGNGVMLAHSANSNAPSRQIPFEFPFPPGTTLRKAFVEFDNLAKKTVAEYQAKQAPRIIGAKTMPNFIGPNGKPLKTGG
jgi:hypothetical protein